VAPFSNALYYPCIAPPSENWLKNAILYWDTIRTIVPVSIKRPYRGRTASLLQDEGYLQPLFVDSDMPEIVTLADEVLSYLDSQEGKDLLKPSDQPRRRVRMSASKGRLGMWRRVEYLNEDKLPEKIKRITNSPPCSLEGWLRVDERFANFYMTLLASRLSNRRGIALLTDLPMVDRFAQVAKSGSLLNIDSGNQTVPGDLANGLLANLIIRQIRIDPKTPIEKVLEFRKKHRDELGFLRTKIAALTNAIKDDQPLEKLVQTVHDIHDNQYLPSCNAFEKALRASKLRTLAETLKIGFFSTSMTSLPIVLGASTPHTLIAGASLSLIASAITYYSNKVSEIGESPYLYLLTAKRKLA
jgi:hypothetical protein